MLNNGEKCELLTFFFSWRFKVMLNMINMNVEEFKLEIYWIKLWVLVLVKDVWIWINVASYCG
jgi:hypothetical protein